MAINNHFLRYLFTGLVSVMMVGCSSTASVADKTYFLLNSQHQSKAIVVSGEPNVSIRRVKVPSYLDQQGIARKRSDGKIEVSVTDLWAEKLSSAIPLVLAKNMEVKLASPVETHPLPPGIRVDTLVEVNVMRLLGDAETLSIQTKYRLIKPKKLETYYFNDQIPLENPSTTALVDGYNQALNRLAIDITKHL